jgi:hypothetical protein
MKIWEVIMDWATAYYNPNNGKISAKSRLVYLHEEGHSKQSPVLFVLYSNLFVFVLPGLVMLYTQDVNLCILFLLAMGLPLYLEYDAWQYAVKEYGNERRQATITRRKL